jgi:hypothetical protein
MCLVMGFCHKTRDPACVSCVLSCFLGYSGCRQRNTPSSLLQDSRPQQRPPPSRSPPIGHQKRLFIRCSRILFFTKQTETTIRWYQAGSSGSLAHSLTHALSHTLTHYLTHPLEADLGRGVFWMVCAGSPPLD